jgi:hypothetical protein
VVALSRSAETVMVRTKLELDLLDSLSSDAAAASAFIDAALISKMPRGSTFEIEHHSIDTPEHLEVKL